MTGSRKRRKGAGLVYQLEQAAELTTIARSAAGCLELSVERLAHVGSPSAVRLILIGSPQLQQFALNGLARCSMTQATQDGGSLSLTLLLQLLLLWHCSCQSCSLLPALQSNRSQLLLQSHQRLIPLCQSSLSGGQEEAAWECGHRTVSRIEVGILSRGKGSDFWRQSAKTARDKE